MDAGFWLERWEKNQIAFHLPEPNPLLVRHFAALALPPKSRVLIPLCGKTVDIAWLLAQGCRVAGIELAEKAVTELFSELAVVPRTKAEGQMLRHFAEDIDILAGDVFQSTAEQIGPIDAVYDRAALVAMPAESRARYAAHVGALSGGAPQLMITYEYDQQRMAGPPFSISVASVEEYYGASYSISLLESAEVRGGLKGEVAAKEHVWLLRAR